MKDIIKEIIFYGPNVPCQIGEDIKRQVRIQSVTDWSTEELDKLIKFQNTDGFKEYYLRSGYPVYCQKCGAPVTLSPIANDTVICDFCQRKANIYRTKLAKAYI